MPASCSGAFKKFSDRGEAWELNHKARKAPFPWSSNLSLFLCARKLYFHLSSAIFVGPGYEAVAPPW